MKKIIMILVLTCLVIGPMAVSALAKHEGLTGDFARPEGAVKVADATALADGADVVMVGRIEDLKGGTKYKFSDPSGTVLISIDYKDQDVLDGLGANNIVEVYGVVEHDFDELFVKVDRIVIVRTD